MFDTKYLLVAKWHDGSRSEYEMHDLKRIYKVCTSCARFARRYGNEVHFVVYNNADMETVLRIYNIVQKDGSSACRVSSIGKYTERCGGYYL